MQLTVQLARLTRRRVGAAKSLTLEQALPDGALETTTRAAGSQAH